jgi:hypothetical protein
MKNQYKAHILLFGLAYILFLLLLTSCEQEEAVVEMNAAPGGGTVSTYKAYTLDPVTADDVKGRIVFYKDNSNFTLVQVSLYNTAADVEYESKLVSGDAELEGAEVLEELYNIDGTTGEFSPGKFFVISDKDFFDSLGELDAHLKIIIGETLVSVGNIGMNAIPVAESE